MKNFYVIFVLYIMIFISDLISGEIKIIDTGDIHITYHSPYYAIDCFNSKHCIAVGKTWYLGTTHFRFSKNNLNKWESFIGDEGIAGKKVKYLNPGFCIVTADSGYYYISRDSLKTWERVLLDTTWYRNIVDSSLTHIPLDDVFFLNEYFGCIENISSLFITTDGTKNWITLWPEQINTGLPDSLKMKYVEDVFITENGIIYILGSSIHFKSSSDTGRTWTSYLMPIRGIRSLYFIDSLRGWVCGGRQKQQYSDDYWSTILYTSDGGRTWEVQLDTLLWPNDPLMRIKFWDENTGIALGYRSILWITTDGGRNWIRDGTLRSNGLGWIDDITFIDTDKILAVEGRLSGNIIYQYNFLNGTNIEESFDDVCSLVISPNPASNLISIKFNNENNFQNLKLKIIDIFGNEIKSIPNPATDKENSEINMDISGLQSGVYFIKSVIGGKVEIAKFVKMY